MSEFEEDLPQGCPPDDAFPPIGEKYYRLAKNNPPEDTDLMSERAKNPKKNFKHDECTVRSLSIWSSFSICQDLQKLPRHKKKVILELVLQEKDGVLKDTFSTHHYSWWKSKTFDKRKINLIE